MFKAFPLLLLVVLVYNVVAFAGPAVVGTVTEPDVVAESSPDTEPFVDDVPDPEGEEELDVADEVAGADEEQVDGAETSTAPPAAFSAHALMHAKLFSVNMPSDEVWRVSYGDAFMTIGLLLLFVELVRSTSSDGNAIVNHALSLGVLVLCLVEFIIVPGFATSTFFFLMLMAAIDVVAGFIISIRAARRDLSVGV